MNKVYEYDIEPLEKCFYEHEYRIGSWHAGSCGIYKVFRFGDKHKILERRVRYI
jgi:hypothetical protein